MRNVKDLYISLIFFTIIVINGISAEKKQDYKVLIGMDHEKVMQLKEIKTLVIDAEFFLKKILRSFTKTETFTYFLI